MKIKIEKSKFQEALNAVRDVAGGNPTLMILRNVLLKTEGTDKVSVTATNLDVVITKTVACEVVEPGETTVPARFLSNATSALVSPIVEFVGDGNSASKAELTGGETNYKIVQINPKEFPKAATVEGATFDVEEEDLRGFLRMVSYATSKDITRRSLKGVNLAKKGDEAYAVGTDGRRLSILRGCPFGDADFSVVIPDTTVSFVQKLISGKGKVTFTIGTSGIIIEGDTWRLQSNLVDEQYPNVFQVIPKDYTHKVEIDRNTFMSAVKQVEIAASVDSPSIIMSIAEDTVVISAVNSDISGARTSFAVKYDGEKEKIVASPKYVLDILNNLTSDTLTFNFTDGSCPFSFTCDGETKGSEFLGLVMPLRVN